MVIDLLRSWVWQGADAMARCGLILTDYRLVRWIFQQIRKNRLLSALETGNWERF